MFRFLFEVDDVANEFVNWKMENLEQIHQKLQDDFTFLLLIVLLLLLVVLIAVRERFYGHIGADLLRLQGIGRRCCEF